MQTKLLILLIIFKSFCIASYSQATDSLYKHSLIFKKLPLYNLWFYSDNPVKIAYFPYENIGNFSLKYGMERGDYRRVIHSKSKNYLHMNAEGYSHVKSTSFYGKILYYNAKEKGLKWNNTSFISEHNPFIIADSIGGNYDNEIFSLHGSISSNKPKNGIKWGLGANYTVGSKSNQLDPRPRIRSMRASIVPGIIFSQKEWEIGLNLFLEKFKEEINFTVVNHMINYRYFRFMGFGQYQGNTGTFFERLYQGWNYGGAFQVKYQNQSLSNIIELKIGKEYERAQEGARTTKYLAGDYSAMTYNLSETVTLLKNNKLHQLNLNIQFIDIKGVWFNQEERIDNTGTSYWHVHSQSIRYKKKDICLNMGYSFIKKEKNRIKYKINPTVLLDIEKSNFFPDNFVADIYNLKTGTSGNKNYFFNDFNMSIDIYVGYRFNLKENINITDIELRETISYPEFYYRSSDYLIANSKITFNIDKTDRSHIVPFISIQGNYTYVIDDNKYYNNTYRLFTYLKVGFIF